MVCGLLRSHTRNSVKERDPICGSHLCMDEWNRPTPVRWRLSLTQAAPGNPIPTGLAPVRGTKARSLEAFLQYSVFHLWLVHLEARMPCLARLFERFHTAGINGRLDLVSLGEYLKTHLKDHTKYDRGPEIHGEPRRVSLPVGSQSEVQLAGCLRVQVGGPLEWDAGIQ